MKVTIVVCDRCGKEMRETDVEDAKLDLTLKYDVPQGGWRPFKKRVGVELCPSCRDAFADWLGQRGEEIDGLRVGGEAQPNQADELRVQAATHPEPE